MTSLGTYCRTLRHLKGRQIVGRFVFKAGAPTPRWRSAPLLRQVSGNLFIRARRSQSLLRLDGFRFLNVERSLNDVGWDSPDVDKLWRYNLHYFDDLHADGAEDRSVLHAELIDRWIRENPPVKGTGWEPYPTSLRIVNWVMWFARTGQIKAHWVESLAMQVRWLSRRLEWHLLGNHLFANAKALFFAGMYFDGSEADAWRSRGLGILRTELPEQVLPDGGQFELTPMYHLLALEDLLDLQNLIGAYGELDARIKSLRDEILRTTGHMLVWAEIMQHQDGGLPRFNDSAEGMAPSLPDLHAYARALHIPMAPASYEHVVHLPASGYIRMDWDGARALLDVAPVGPDYLPGHAHADTLSFELSIQGRQVIVNRGTSCYGMSARRGYERGTSAHSTVEVCGQNSSETWGGFRVGRRARPVGLVVNEDGASCGHDGYGFLRGSPEHRRTWHRLDRGLVVEDVIGAEYPAIVRYHLAPGLEARLQPKGHWVISDGDLTVATVEIEGGAIHLEQTLHAGGFGVLIAAQTLEIELQGGRSVTRWSW